MNISGSRLLICRLQGTPLAFDLSLVAEVIEIPHTWTIPLSPTFFRGVINSHGSPLPLLDLASYLGHGETAADGKVVVLDRKIGDLAFMVDDVMRVVPVDEAVMVRDAEEPGEGYMDIDGEEVLVISAELLVDMLESNLQRFSHGKRAEIRETL